MTIFFSSEHSGRQIKNFLKHLNSFDPSLKFTHESSKESLPFLEKGIISTDLHIIDTDIHQYLHYTSSHQALRVKRICSEEKDLQQHILQMRSLFQKRAYPNKVLDEELVKGRFSNQEKTKVKVFRLLSRMIPYFKLLAI